MSKENVKCVECGKVMRADTLARHSKIHAKPVASNTVDEGDMKLLEAAAAENRLLEAEKPKVPRVAEPKAKTKSQRFPKEMFIKHYYELQHDAHRWIHNVIYGTRDCTPKCAARSIPCKGFKGGDLSMYTDSQVDGMYMTWLSPKH